MKLLLKKWINFSLNISFSKGHRKNTFMALSLTFPWHFQLKVTNLNNVWGVANRDLWKGWGKPFFILSLLKPRIFTIGWLQSLYFLLTDQVVILPLTIFGGFAQQGICPINFQWMDQILFLSTFLLIIWSFE